MDCRERPQIDPDNKDQGYNSTNLYESVREVTRLVKGAAEKGDSDIADGGSVAARKFWYRLCRDVLYSLKNL